MYCLHCGDCCLRMSPISAPEPCPYLIVEKSNEERSYHFCKIYKNRPKQCIDHEFPCQFCPIGMSIFKFEDPTRIQIHLENGYLKTRELEF